MLIEQSRSLGRVYILVDAMDRVDRNLAFRLLDALEALQNATGNVSIMVSSPEIRGYRSRLGLAREHTVCGDDREVSVYVRRRIARSSPSLMHTMVQEDEDLESEIQEIVKEKSDGMYVSQSFIRASADVLGSWWRSY